MADNKECESDFALKGLKFTYQKNFKAFICDQRDILTILQHNYPANFEKLIERHPELKAVSLEMKEQEAKETVTGSHTLDCWKPIEIKETKEVTCQVKDGCPIDETQMTGRGRPGIISRLSKGIKKIIAKITPTKLRKRWRLEEEDPKDCEVEVKH